MILAMMVMMICSTIISKTSNFSSSGSRWARTKAKTFLEYKKCKKCVYALFAVSTLHVFATIAQPTSNLVLAQKLWSIRVCIQVCVCICIDQELAFVFLLGDSNMISVFRTLSGLASSGIFLFLISHVDCNLIPLSYIIQNSGHRILCGLRRHQTNHICSARHVRFSQ